MACTAWQKLEDRIREIASFRWGCVAAPEKIAGVDIDCVLKPSTDHWIAGHNKTGWDSYGPFWGKYILSMLFCDVRDTDKFYA